MAFDCPVAPVVLRKINADGLAVFLLEFWKACFAVKEFLKRCFRIRDDFLPCFGTTFVDPCEFVHIFQMVVHEFVEVHRREEMLLMPVETAALIQVIQALVPRDVLVVKPSANANGAANFATLLRRQKNLRLVTL